MNTEYNHQPLADSLVSSVLSIPFVPVCDNSSLDFPCPIHCRLSQQLGAASVAACLDGPIIRSDSSAGVTGVEAGAYSQLPLGKWQGTPWTGRRSITGPHRDKRDTQPCTLTIIPWVNLESPNKLTCRRKPEYPERTHSYTGRTCKLHTERPGFKPGMLLLWGDGANHHTTVQPFCKSAFVNKKPLNFLYCLKIRVTKMWT